MDNPRIDWKSIITGLVIGEFAFKTYINYRQYQVLKKPEPPKSLKSEVSTEVFLQSQKYARATSKFRMLRSVFSTVKELAILRLDLLPKLWSVAGQVSVRLSKLSIIGRFLGHSVLSQSVTMYAVTSTISALFALPFSYYDTFVLEEEFGFNKSSFKTWLGDKAKGLFLNVGFGSPIVYVFFRILDNYGSAFVPYACVFGLVAELVMLTVIPTLIFPLFYKYTPLEDGELKTQIEALANKNSFPATEVYVVDGSSRSSHSNAFFTGLPWNKQIALFDTLIEQNSTEQIIAVLAHEIGHWKMNHITQMIVTHQSSFALSFVLFSVFFENKSLLEAFGFSGLYPAYIAYYLFTYVESPLGCATQFLQNLITRKNELQADNFAKSEGHGEELGKALIALTKENLDSLDVDWVYSAYNHLHPTLAERLSAIGYLSEKEKGDLKLAVEKN